MAPPTDGHHSGVGGSSQKPSTYHQYLQSNIDQGTEMFRKKLEEDIKSSDEKTKDKPLVQGGVPPHLLRQSQHSTSSPASDALSAHGSGTPAQPRDHCPRHSQAIPQHTQNYRNQITPSQPFQNYQPQSRLSKMTTAEDCSPSQAYDARDTYRIYGPDPTGPAPSNQVIIRQQNSRPQPLYTSLMNRSDAHVGWESSSSNVGPQQQQQQQHPRTPTYGRNDRGETQRADMVFMKAKDAPGTHPALRGIMNSRWCKQVRISDDCSEKESFPAQVQHVSTWQQTTMPQPQSLMCSPKGPTPRQESFNPRHNGGVRLSTSPYQAQHARTTAAVQQLPVNQSQTMALVQKTHNEIQPEKQRKWRPKHSVDLESQSLPTSVSCARFNDDSSSVRDIDSGSDASLDLSLKRKSKGLVNKTSIQDYHTDGQEDTFTQGLQPSNCRDWVASLPDKQPPFAWGIHNKVEGNEHCDLQPRNGYFMPPIDYPPTQINPKDKDQRGAMSRRLVSSAKLRSAVYLDKNKRRLENEERKSLERELVDPSSHWRPVVAPFPAPQPTTLPTQHVVGDQDYSGFQGYDGTNSNKAVRSQVDDSVSQACVGPITQGNNQGRESYVKITCFMRPAEPGDLPQVLDIYNWEVVHGIQALDNKTLCLQDIQNVLSQCKSAQTPFIVMIEGTPAEAAIRKETPAPPRGPYQSYSQGPYQQSQKPQQDKVLGFGFISILSTGLAGDANHNVGRFQGRAHFYVANDVRRKGIGRALMTRLAQCCSIYTVCMGEFEWHDPDRNAACDTVGFNARNYSRLFIETASRNKADPDTIWLAKLLDSEHFFCVCTMDNARKVGSDDKGIWLDNLVWQLDCQDPESIRENSKKWQ